MIQADSISDGAIWFFIIFFVAMIIGPILTLIYLLKTEKHSSSDRQNDLSTKKFRLFDFKEPLQPPSTNK